MALLINLLLYLLLGVCAICDVREGRIPNKFTYSAIVVGLVLNFVIGGFPQFLNSLLGFALGFAMMFFVYLWGGFGGGDVKLMAAIGALKGYPFVIYAAFYSAIVGGVYSLAVLIWRGRLQRSLVNVGMQFVAFVRPGSSLALKLDPKESVAIPFGFCICIGTLWAVLENILGRSVWHLIQRF